jgi:lipopolysaccharide transport protein LptA
MPVLAMIRELECQIQYKSMKKALICSLLSLLSFPCIAAPLDADAFETVSISADEAIEDERPGILHFDGNFQMRSDEWQLTSSQATVYGSLNKPDRIYLEGSPARFLLRPADKTERENIEATALTVEYLRDTNSLKLSGSARLMVGDEVIQSTFINYDIDTDRYQAGGENGVLIDIPTVDR